MSEGIKVKLLTDGMFSNADAIVGATVNACKGATAGYDIALEELRAVGYVGDGSITEGTLHFFDSEVEVIDG